jgi:hypothetical protein
MCHFREKPPEWLRERTKILSGKQSYLRKYLNANKG